MIQIGAGDIVVSSDLKSKNDEGSLGATPRKYFLPKELENATPEMIWEWWQKRGQQESLLKNAIVSAKVQSSDFSNLPTNFLDSYVYSSCSCSEGQI
jgi:hypothetical protein